ncbi:hypothetical protein [Methanobacterium oryzae]|uniref:hypothetical protein n=1 Tax=Methanobacterium oryzae TaxID=69540 RepID=UPI003D221C6C
MSTLKIVTTPMCEKILQLAGISNYIVSQNPNKTNADIVITLSETKITNKSIKIKLNTFSQIEESIKTLSEFFETNPLSYKIENEIDSKSLKKNRKIKVKVYSNFLKDIVQDMGFTITDEFHDFVVYPDYMKDKIINEIEDNIKTVEIPSHRNVPLDPIKRAEMRYAILEKKLCMKP